MNANDWDERFSGELPYGLAPNDFVAEQAGRIPAGPVLCLAEGYGRNALFLAAQGHPVTAVEQSSVGIARGKALGAERGVEVTWVHADLADYDMGQEAWSGIVSTFAHVPPTLRAEVHARVARALAPGGIYILEAYSPAQLGYRSGGPKDVALLMTRDGLVNELAELEFDIAQEIERELTEGAMHRGPAAVVQVVARKARKAR